MTIHRTPIWYISPMLTQCEHSRSLRTVLNFCLFIFIPQYTFRRKHFIPFTMSAQAIVETDLEIVQPQPLRLHENGDVTLILESSDGKTQTNIIASTDILSAASGYCAKLLHSLRRKKVDSESRQKEDSESRRKEDPESGKPLTLQDEDAEATKIVLSILHYKFNENCKNLSPLMLARVSKQCWMYECTGAVQVHFDLWMQSMPPNDPRTNPLLFIENLGYLIFSALLFQREDAVRSITRDAVYHLSLGFQTAWTKNQIISLLPDEICSMIGKLDISS